jgi:hypothetical protein
MIYVALGLCTFCIGFIAGALWVALGQYDENDWDY